MAVKIKQVVRIRARNRKAKYKVKYKVYQNTNVSDKGVVTTTTGKSRRIYVKKKYSYWHKT